MSARLALGVIAGLLIGAPAPAQDHATRHMDKALFLEMATSGADAQLGLLRVYLRGVLAGLESADMILRREGRRRLACPPPDTVLDPDWAINELIGYFARYPNSPDSSSVALNLQFLLAELFPCERNTADD